MSELKPPHYRLYYRHDPARLSCCTLTVHALLHIADDIRRAGPVWAYWAFIMERYCGHLQPAIKSRRYPWKSLDHHIELDTLLSQARITYQLEDELDLEPQRPRKKSLEITDPACMFLRLS